MAPAEPIFFAEKANVELRVGKTDEAIATAQQSIRISPDNSDGYLILGLAQCVKGQKSEGIQNLNKAKELGNSQAQTLIEKFSK
jgi:tetratricopeptide (TPR) repeat protein